MKQEFPIAKYTVQLYYSPANSSSPPEQIATGNLIRSSSKYFLLTCKHVFENICVEDVVILTSLGFAVRLSDDVTFIDDENTSIDLALIRFKAESLEHLKAHYTFLPSKNIGFDHVFTEGLWYMLYGYINKKTILKNGFDFYAQPYGFLTMHWPRAKFEKLGFNYKNNVTMEYNRKQLILNDDTRVFGPNDLKGLSGGGIWLSVAGKKRGTYNYILVGILIEERTEQGFLIGTKVSLIKEAFWRK